MPDQRKIPTVAELLQTHLDILDTGLEKKATESGRKMLHHFYTVGFLSGMESLKAILDAIGASSLDEDLLAPVLESTYRDIRKHLERASAELVSRIP